MKTYDQINDELSAFYAAHLAKPGALIVVYAQFKVGIFNDLSRALAWADAVDEPVVFSPYMLNNPEFQEVQSRYMN